MIEIEQKFHINDPASLEQQLLELGAVETTREHHVDTYFQHPCRNFAETNEAVRIRQINGQGVITYKGPRDPGPVKVREELEWSLAPGDADGSQMKNLLLKLGFHIIAEVEKNRRPFQLSGGSESLMFTIDNVRNIGFYVEIEAIAANRDGVATARSAVLAFSDRLGLRTLEQKSYLTLVLESAK